MSKMFGEGILPAARSTLCGSPLLSKGSRLLAALALATVLGSDAAAQLDVDFTAAPTSGVAALTVSFNDTTTGGTSAFWFWDFGDGTLASAMDPSPTHTYLSPGTYTVSLQVFASGGLIDTETKVDFITVAPTAIAVDFSATPTQGLIPLTVNFSDETTGAVLTAWSWDFGDGATSTLQNPTHTYTTVGSHAVSLTAFVGQAQTTAVKPDLITVPSSPLVAAFSAAPKQGAIPLTMSFSDLSTGAVVTSWSWDFGDGGVGFGSNPSHEYSAPGTYTVELQVLAGAQSASLSAQIEVDGGQFGPQQGLVSVFQSPMAHSADLDGDGDVDLLTANMGSFKFGSGLVVWSENTDGQGSFGPTQTISSDANTPVSVFAADLDGDGDADALSASSGDDSISWYENMDGLGSFGPLQAITTNADGAALVKAADLDSDGDMDVLSGSSVDRKVAWYENMDGLGSFGPQQVIGLAPLFGLDIQPDDLDGDGDMDVLFTASTGVAWLENTDGLGTFGSEQLISTVIATPVSVSAADLDGDGDSDALFASKLAGGVAWHENLDGLGSFSTHAIIDTVPGSGFDAKARDFDGDGDLDVVFASGGAGGDTIQWFENIDGLATFGPGEILTKGGFSPLLSIGLADLDGDGDSDLHVSSLSEFEISWYENTLASLAWPFLGNGLAGSNGAPVLSGSGNLTAGEQVTLTLTNGLPVASSALVMGLSSITAPFKGGLLVPAPDLIVSGLTLDAAGSLTLGDRWPAGVPAGVTVWFQSWVNDPVAPQGLAASNGLSGTTLP